MSCVYYVDWLWEAQNKVLQSMIYTCFTTRLQATRQDLALWNADQLPSVERVQVSFIFQPAEIARTRRTEGGYVLEFEEHID